MDDEPNSCIVDSFAKSTVQMKKKVETFEKIKVTVKKSPSKQTNSQAGKKKEQGSYPHNKDQVPLIDENEGNIRKVLSRA